MKQWIWAALALAGTFAVGLLTAAPPRHHRPDPVINPDRDYWAAIVYSKSTGAYGFAINQKTKDDAEKTALAQVQAPDAVVVKTLDKGYAGLVIDPSGNYEVIAGESEPGIASEKGTQEAERQAKKKNPNGVLALLVGHAGFARQKAPVGGGDRYAAISRSDKTHRFGYCFGVGSQDEAEKQAVQNAGGDKDGTTVSATTWCAMADEGPNGGWGLATGDTQDEAGDKAMDEAAKHAKSPRLVFVVSGDGFVIRYPDGPMEGNGSAR